MRALISGQAATAITFDGGIIRSIHIDEPDQVVERKEWEVERILMGMTDTIELDNLSREQVIEELESSWRKDRSLPLIMILIDEGEEPETRQMTAEALSEFFSDDIKQYIGSILYTEPLPATADLPGAIGHSKHSECTELTEFLEELHSNQGLIRVWRDAWSTLPLTLFGDQNEREQFRLLAIKAGAFYKFVTQQGNVDGVLLDLLLREEFTGTTRAREVFQALTEPFKSKAHPKPLVQEAELPEQKGSTRSRGKRKGIHKKYTNVDTQIEAIKKLLTDGKKDKAIGWLSDLIESQRAESRPRYICQTLCNIAQHAKSLGDIPLQLQLSEWAVQEMPADGWAYAQVGDAYRALGQPNEALVAYGKAASLGGERVALCGKAALLKDSGNLNEALALYEECVERYSDEPVARNGRAEVLKEQGKLSEALLAYDETIKLFQQNPTARCGRAEVLKEQGKLSEALLAYDETIKLFQQDPTARCGRAEVLKEQGKLSEALLAYQETIKSFPHNIFVRNGKASVLVSMRRFEEALETLPSEDPTTRGEWIAYHIRGMALLRSGETETAIDIFNRGIEGSPWACDKSYFQTAFAMAMIRKKEYRKAIDFLQTQVRSSFRPVARVLQIHAYGELDELEKARSAFEDVRESKVVTIVRPRDELAGRYGLEHPDFIAKPDDWLFERECDMVLAAAA